MGKRIISVSRDWFEQLETYLQARERFMSPDLLKESKLNIVLDTPEGRRLVFVPEQKS